MKYHLDNLHKELKKFSLEKEEKASIRQSLISYMAVHPLKGEEPVRIVSPFYKKYKRTQISWYQFFRSSTYVSAFVVIALVLGGSVSMAAENALPGDTLYGFKTDINEGILTALAVTPESQAELQTELATKRIREAEQLIKKNGKLSDSDKEIITTGIVKHTKSFTAEAKKIQDNKTVVAAASKLEATLTAHKDVLLTLEASTTVATATSTATSTGEVATTATSTDPTEVISTSTVTTTVISPDSVSIQLNAAISEVQSARSDAEDRVKAEESLDVQTSAIQNLELAIKSLNDFKIYLEGVKGSVSQSAYTEAQVRIKEAEEALIKGEGEIDSELYGDAYVSLQESIKKITEARVSLEAVTKLNISGSKPGKSTSATTTLNATTTATSTELQASTTSATPKPTLKSKLRLGR
jgi:hypothetical protein